MTAVSLVIGTSPTQTAVSHVTATPRVHSVRSVSLRAGNVNVNRGLVASDVTHAAAACTV